MHDLLAEFFADPSGPRYLSLRKQFLQDERWSRSSAGSDLPWNLLPAHWTHLFELGRYEELLADIEGRMPLWGFSLAAHRWSAWALFELGDDDTARLEQFLWHGCLTGLLGTGAGDRASPWQVTYPGDGRELLRQQGLEVTRQEMIVCQDRVFDRLVTSDRDFWCELPEYVTLTSPHPAP